MSDGKCNILAGSNDPQYRKSVRPMQVASPRRLAFSTLVLSLLAATAGAQTPSPEQLQIFQNLSPEQQQAVLQQMGPGANSQASGAQRASTTSRAADASEVARHSALAMGEMDELLPVLKADDTLVIEISLGAAATGRSTAPSASGNAPRQPTRAEEAGRLRRERLVAALDPEARRKLDDLVALVLSRNPYQLDRNAALNLPGFAPVTLGGLTEEQATQRLSLEPVLLPLEVHVTRLPVFRTGVAGLKPFGYDLFDNAAATFSPVTDVPVPADYVIGPGDALNVQLYGSQNRNLPLIVDRDGVVSFPELGPIRVGGMGFNAVRRAIETRVTQQMRGVQASVSMGDTRGIRVFVLGEAKLPGSYTVPGLATMTTALFASGGVKPIGSLRDIQLKRQGQIVRRFDLYDMLIRGDTSDDARLLPGDVIFIPPAGPTISVDGEVKRPAIYELRDETSMADVVRMAGGYTAEADATRASLTRIGADGLRSVLDVSLAQGGRGQPPHNGDVLRIGALRPQVDAGVTLDGFVYRPGPVAWREGLRLTDVLASVDELRPNADQHYILIRRENGAARHISVVSADLTAALAAPGSAANVQLAPRDRITVVDVGPGRERIVQPLMEELKLQSELADPTPSVSVGGRVKVPGSYPLETGMRVADLLRAGGNLDSSAFGGSAELTRYTVDPDGTRQTELITVDLPAIRRGDASANLQLRPFDYLMIKETPDWSDQESIRLKGEVRFPGLYAIRKGETLKQVLERAGGLTALAFPQGSAFTREDLKVLEQKQLDRLGERLRSDLASLALSAANGGQSEAAQSLQSGQALLAQLQGATATGRFVIDLPGLLAGATGGDKDVMLRNGDELVIPRQRQEVTVIGEVQNATSHLYFPKLKRDQYIAASGGMTRKADKGRVYIVRADGNVAGKGGVLFARNYDSAIRPGDTIVVPLDTERMPRLPFWQALTQILYNVAVSVAAVNSF
jgi:polysaccharide biosynthesis/export protein